MKKILIVSKIFAPINEIGAIRPTKFAKYLKVLGYYQVDVIASSANGYNHDTILDKDSKNIDNIYRLQKSPLMTNLEKLLYKTYKRIETTSAETVSKKPDSKRFLTSIKSFIKYFLLLLGEYDYYLQFKKLKLDYEKYDYMISTFSTHANHKIANHVTKKNKKIAWIADYRDPVYQESVPFGFKKYTKSFAMKQTQNANAIIAVSQGCLDALYINSYGGKTKVITNGFDREDLQFDDFANDTIFEKFTLTYTGDLYNGKRDLSPLFKAIRELIDDGFMSSMDIQICYAGHSYDSFFDQTSAYYLSDVIKNYGFIERKESLGLQLKSHVLLFASWNTANEKGVVTGKLLEYMMMEKPILGVISGELENSKVKEIVDMCNIGFVYESARRKVDYNLMKQYIIKQYQLFKTNKNLIFEPNQEEIEKYNYRNLTNELANLFAEINS